MPFPKFYCHIHNSTRSQRISQDSPLRPFKHWHTSPLSLSASALSPKLHVKFSNCPPIPTPIQLPPSSFFSSNSNVSNCPHLNSNVHSNLLILPNTLLKLFWATFFPNTIPFARSVHCAPTTPSLSQFTHSCIEFSPCHHSVHGPLFPMTKPDNKYFISLTFPLPLA